MSNATDKQWLDALGSRLGDALNCSDLDIDTTELIVASFQIGLLSTPKLLDQFKQGNSLIESSYFEAVDDEFPREVKGKNWKMVIRKAMNSKPIA
jgi:hypothetical protein